MDPFELDINRQNTRYFIAARPSVIILTPQTREDTPSGGFKFVDGVPRLAQEMRIIEIGLNQAVPVLTLQDGKQRDAEFLLLGNFDAIVEIDDYWVADDGREWIIGDVIRSNDYEVRALVAERGR